jgi:hypothetical protein
MLFLNMVCLTVALTFFFGRGVSGSRRDFAGGEGAQRADVTGQHHAVRGARIAGRDVTVHGVEKGRGKPEAEHRVEEDEVKNGAACGCDVIKVNKKRRSAERKSLRDRGVGDEVFVVWLEEFVDVTTKMKEDEVRGKVGEGEGEKTRRRGDDVKIGCQEKGKSFVRNFPCHP